MDLAKVGRKRQPHNGRALVQQIRDNVQRLLLRGQAGRGRRALKSQPKELGDALARTGRNVLEVLHVQLGWGGVEG